MDAQDLAGPVESAHAVGLRYVTDSMPGIQREGAPKHPRYRYPTGDVVRDGEVLGRIKGLVIPPAWRDVWICPDPRGHLQATGRDARNRKQHRYHRSWREVRDDTKYARMIQFGKTLPKIREHLARDLRKSQLCREKVLATIVRLLEVSLIRVGNDEYAKTNDSFGLTTMRDRHVDISGSKLRFSFRGKSGVWHEVDIRDQRLAKIVKRCQELPGQELFQYLNEKGKRQSVDSTDVNNYLREISGQEFTAKDFRTWAGTVLGALALREFGKFDSKAQAKKNLTTAIESVAKKLGNTPTVCKKCYVHPEIINSYLDGTLPRTLGERAGRGLKKPQGKLRPEEAAVLSLLQQRLRRSREDIEKTLKRALALKRPAFSRRGGRS
jgi:DNA topoisomerase-1